MPVWKGLIEILFELVQVFFCKKRSGYDGVFHVIFLASKVRSKRAKS
jgi:hypothetical protein